LKCRSYSIKIIGLLWLVLEAARRGCLMRKKILMPGYRHIALHVIVSLLLALSFTLPPENALGAEEKDSYSATLVGFEGEVFIQKHGEDIWLPAEADIPLEQGDKIKTGKDGLAEILMDDGSMAKLEEESELTIRELSASYEKKSISASLFLFFGRMLSNVAKFTSRSSRFDVETPTLVAGVRGTEFIVETTDSEQTDVGVFDGKVAVAGLDKEGKRIKESEVLLNRGFETRVQKGKRPLVPFGLRKEMLAQRKKLEGLRKKAGDSRRRLPDIMKNRIKARDKAAKKWEKIRLEKEKQRLDKKGLQQRPSDPKKKDPQRRLEDYEKRKQRLQIQQQENLKRKKRYEQKLQQEQRDKGAKALDKKGNRR